MASAGADLRDGLEHLPFGHPSPPGCAAGFISALAMLPWECFEKPFIRHGQPFRYDLPA
ncbi:hypothetical protein Cabther_A1522 [Chloracidobacterium thermophilum B]|uniref:Uncharacterized protein n=1 Tax=Chloracidobacterium thermophilum (strain B) TaxID=981222 RepID=G2LIQ4_CHLTF|nr:hypothetical protein Cabther_A1522 [Chloracidobacterium thermophilum B]